MQLLKELILKNYRKKLGALALAIMTWWIYSGYNSNNNNYSVIDVPIIYSGLQSEYIVTSMLKEQARLTIKTSKAGLNLNNVSNYHLNIDLSQLKLGVNYYNPNASDFSGPSDIISIEPRVLEIKIEKKLSKLVKIQPTFTGSIPLKIKNYIKVNPLQIFISGPGSVLESLVSIPTVPIDPQVLLNDKDLFVKLQLPLYTTSDIQGVIVKINR